MTKHTRIPGNLSDKAEGSPDSRERQEPASPLKTSTLPIIDHLPNFSAGETGIIRAINQNAEDRDDADTQDASLTKDETKLKTEKSETQSIIDDVDTPILIVEDTVELAEVIEATLEGLGLEVISATHGKMGLEKLKAVNPSLVLLDIGLPDTSGWQILDHIKDHYADNEADMPSIIVITAYGDPANRLIGKLQNIHSYLIKPFTPDQVENLVMMALRGEKPAEPPDSAPSSSG
jgi:CheY-like chemotaxis protein